MYKIKVGIQIPLVYYCTFLLKRRLLYISHIFFILRIVLRI